MTGRTRRLRERGGGRTALAAVAAVIAAGAAGSAPAVVHADGVGTASGLTHRYHATFCDGPEPRERRHNHGGDLAFWGKRAVLACGADDEDLYNDGFVVLDVKDRANPVRLGALFCVASASDIAIWKDLVFLAVDRNAESKSESGPVTGEGSDIGLTPDVNPGPVGTECKAKLAPHGEKKIGHFQGVRIVSIKDPANPVVVKSIMTNEDEASKTARGAGAHNVTVVPDLEHIDASGLRRPRVLVYALTPRFPEQDIIAVPLDDPAAAAVVAAVPTPGLFAVGGQYPRDQDGCHDLSVFLPRGIAACHVVPAVAGATGTILFDLRDDPDDLGDDGATLTRPVRRSVVLGDHPGRRDHSGAFSWDGGTLVVTDESLVNLASPSCDESSGRLWFYDVTDIANPSLVGSHRPAPSTPGVWCYPKQISVIPLKDGRDVLVASWLGGGTSLVDFTNVRDRTAATEIASYVDRDPTDRTDATAWAAHWYGGMIYVNNAYACARPFYCFGSADRGLDILEPSALLRLTNAAPLPRLNQGLQECLPGLWPGSACDH